MRLLLAIAEMGSGPGTSAGVHEGSVRRGIDAPFGNVKLGSTGSMIREMVAVNGGRSRPRDSVAHTVAEFDGNMKKTLRGQMFNTISSSNTKAIADNKLLFSPPLYTSNLILSYY